MTSCCSVASRTVRVLGTATSMPDCSTGAVSMKMTRSTSTTSTSGVMLMSASADLVRPSALVNATAGLLHCFALTRALPLQRILLRPQGDLFHAVQQLTGKVVHARAKFADARGELVVGDDRRDGDDQSRSGGNEGLGDTGCDGAQCRGTRGAQTMESIHDAHDCAEETDERRDGADGGQPGQALFHERKRFARCRLCRAFQRGNVAWRAIATGLAAVGLIDLVEHIDQRAWLVLLRDRADLLQARRLAKGAQEGTALAACTAEANPLAQNDGPGEETGKGEKSKDGEGE